MVLLYYIQFQKFKTQKNKLLKKVYLLIIMFSISLNVNCQNITYNILNQNYSDFLHTINSNANYWKSNNSYQAKHNNFRIELYQTIGNTAVIKFSNYKDFEKLIKEIVKNSWFNFKYCTSFNEPIVYNFNSEKAKFRFNLSEFKLSVEYPNSTSKYLENYNDLLTVFICDSDNSYAYHTNIKCENLNLCKSNILKTNIKDAKKINYKQCEICSTFE